MGSRDFPSKSYPKMTIEIRSNNSVGRLQKIGMKVHWAHGQRTGRANRTQEARKRIVAAQRVRYEVIREHIFLATPRPSWRMMQL